jgi:aspartate/methionine/tyrosine aminotransferase
VFSRRTGRSRAPNRFAELALEARAGGRALLDLTVTNPTRAGIAYPAELAAVLERAQAASLDYAPESFGSVAARQALSPIAACAVEDLLLTASTSEAYAFLFKLLCDPGDSVLVPAPSYPLFEHLAELESVELVPYRLAYDGAWHIDLDSVRPRPSTRAVLLVSPNNPTGNYVAPGELVALSRFGLPLVIDEVFRDYPLDAAAPASPTVDVLSFRLNGLSKLAGLPQLKLAWTAISGPEALRREARERLELVADTFLSVATPIQRALPELLRLAPLITSAIGQRCRQNLATLRGALVASPVSVLRCEGGWSAVLRLPAIASEDELLTRLLTERALLLQPGWFYDFESEPYAVVSLLPEPDTFEQGIVRLATQLA